ncbi:MAG: LuxR C-terminal-related transcriptional regulator [Oscillospiraceae bacterium]|jgi:LuxR family maltose regulon positive regulatory protein|nr:LuxR C-terminal-related transcriptional regulator [Oscillospiraceae bacterium]
MTGPTTSAGRKPLFAKSAKAVIGEGRALLERSDISALLDKAVEYPLVTVVAGSGYGKTQAVYSFLRNYRAIKIWLQINEFDNFSEKFWESLTNAVSTRDKAFAAKMLSIGFPETQRKFEQFFSLIKNETPPELKFIIVLDDFHRITSRPILQFIEKTALERLENVTAILISRTQPDINAIGMLSKGVISQINEDTLRFSRDEIVRYLKMLDITLTPEAVAEIHSVTDGWAFAVILIGMSLQNGLWHKDYALSAMKSNVFKLIDTEIFSAASDSLQKLLAKLSLINHLSPSLLAELCDDEALIGEMRKISSFIRFDAYTGVYRIHHLFLEYLKLRQEILSDDEKRDVYIRAARRCARDGDKLDAIAYCEKAGDYGGVAESAYTLTRMTPARVAEFLLDILGRLPERAYRENAELYIIKIKLLQSLARFDDAAALANATIASFEAKPETPENCWVLSECYLNLGFVGIYTALYTGIRDHGSHLERGYRYFKLSGGMTRGPRERALVSSYVSRVGYPADKGSLQRGIDAFQGYVDYVIESKNGMMCGMADLAGCEAAYFKADVKKAEGLAHQAIEKARGAEQFQIENRALLLLLRIYIHMGNTGGFHGVLEQLKSQLDNPEFLGGYTLYDIACGWFFAHIRQIDRVAGWLKSDFEKSDLNTLLYGLEKLVQAKCFLAEKKYYAVLAALEGQDGRYGLEAFLIGKLEVTVLRAICKYNSGDRSGAIKTLTQAYDISLAEELDMPFIEMGKDMRTLTAAAMRDGACEIPQAWLVKIHKKSSAYAKTLSYVITEYRNYNKLNEKLFALTAKEKEILTDLCHGLSRTEIAYNRNISVNAVKLLLQTVYSKLGAKNTADAVWIAASMKLVE